MVVAEVESMKVVDTSSIVVTLDDHVKTIEEASEGVNWSTEAKAPEDIDKGNSLKNPRISVNVHNSILNITEEEDEDDYDEDPAKASFLLGKAMSMTFEEPTVFLAVVPETPPRPTQACCEPVSGISTEVSHHRDSSLFDQMTSSFVDSLCFQRESLSGEEENQLAWDNYRSMVIYDIIDQIGCASPPGQEEIQQVWTWHQTILSCQQPSGNAMAPSPKRPPRRHDLQERALRIHRLRQERGIPSRSNGMSPSPSPVSVIRQARSMDASVFHFSSKEAALQKRVGFGLLPVSPELDGYDSDPGEMPSLDIDSDERTGPVKLLPSTPAREMDMYSSENIPMVVRETLNSSWTLTWHPGPTHKHRRNPVRVHNWIERGRMVQNDSVMLEPSLMWREAYQPDLSQRKLSQCSQKPCSIKLLNLCRIRELPPDVNRNDYPMARPSLAFLVRSSYDEEYVFEAASTQERDDIVCRWKVCVARFATLAVLEDTATIGEEFFAASNLPVMPVPDYDSYSAE